METELKRIAEQKTRQQDKRRCVGPQDRNIRQEKEPSHQEAVVLSERFRDKSIGPAGTLSVYGHSVEIERQHGDCHGPDQETDYRAHGPRVRQEH